MRRPERLDTGLGGSETAVLQLAARWAQAPRVGGGEGSSLSNIGRARGKHDECIRARREVVVYLRMTPLDGGGDGDSISAVDGVGGGVGGGAAGGMGGGAAGGVGGGAAGSARERQWRGVRLLDVKSFNPADTFGTLIVWRSLEVLDEPLHAHRILL